MSVTCDRSVVFSEYSSFIGGENWQPEILLKVALNTLIQNSSTSANVGKPKLFQDILKIQYPNTNNMLNEINLNANP